MLKLHVSGFTQYVLLAGVALVSQAIELGYRNAGIKLLGVDCNSNYFREST